MLSTNTATPWACAAAAIASKSGMFSAGFPMVSRYTARVRSSIRAVNSSGRSSRLVKRTSMPRRFRVTRNWLTVPPYRFGLDTMLSPACATFVIARNCAACPLATASAPTPPSSAATRASNTAFVGFMMRL